MAYKEIKIQNHNLAFSDVGTTPLKDPSVPMVPRGSAVITPSGDLAKTGIESIIHVAPGSMTRGGAEYDPSKEGLILSLKNGLHIAKNKKLTCLAMPFIGGGIFLGALKMTKPQLAGLIIDTVSAEKPAFDITFVTWGAEDTKVFTDLLKVKNDPRLKQVEGSITDFKIHKCATIVNAANMEIIFGAGVSGVIGNATGSPEKINQMAKELIQKSKSQK